MNNIIEAYSANTEEKLQKPDFKTKIGREILAFYLQTKFKQILNFDKKQETHLIQEVNGDFIQNFLNRIIHEPNKRILIGITGESASGKSTICETIMDIVNKESLPVSIINSDNYFKDISDLIAKYGSFDNLRDMGHDVDAPENFRLDLLYEQAKKLQEGFDVTIPKYLTNGTGISVLDAIPVKSQKIVVIEGMATMFEPVKSLFDIKIYVEVDNKIRKKRFIERAKTRNQDKENAYKHWEYVEKAGEKYIKPQKDSMDIIINGEADLEYFTQIIEFINYITNNFSEE